MELPFDVVERGGRWSVFEPWSGLETFSGLRTRTSAVLFGLRRLLEMSCDRNATLYLMYRDMLREGS